MASSKHIHGRRQRGHYHIFSSEIPAYEHREKDSIARRTDILAPEHRLPSQWSCQLCQDGHKILAETSVGADWVEDTSRKYFPPLCGEKPHLLIIVAADGQRTGLHGCSMCNSSSLCPVSGN